MSHVHLFRNGKHFKSFPLAGVFPPYVFTEANRLVATVIDDSGLKVLTSEMSSSSSRVAERTIELQHEFHTFAWIEKTEHIVTILTSLFYLQCCYLYRFDWNTLQEAQELQPVKKLDLSPLNRIYLYSTGSKYVIAEGYNPEKRKPETKCISVI